MMISLIHHRLLTRIGYQCHKTTYQKLTKVSGINYLYRHESGGYWGRKKFKGEKSAPLKALPRAHQAASLFKRWIPGTHQAAIGHQHLGDSLHELAFRFNRRKSDSRGKIFFRLAQQAIPITPTTYELLVRPQPVAPC